MSPEFTAAANSVITFPAAAFTAAVFPAAAFAAAAFAASALLSAGGALGAGDVLVLGADDAPVDLTLLGVDLVVAFPAAADAGFSADSFEHA